MLQIAVLNSGTLKDFRYWAREQKLRQLRADKYEDRAGNIYINVSDPRDAHGRRFDACFGYHSRLYDEVKERLKMPESKYIDVNKYVQIFKHIGDTVLTVARTLQPHINAIRQVTKLHNRALHLANHHKKARTRKKNINRLRREIRLALKRGQL